MRRRLLASILALLAAFGAVSGTACYGGDGGTEQDGGGGEGDGGY
jgi:hypothetical protein